MLKVFCDICGKDITDDEGKDVIRSITKYQKEGHYRSDMMLMMKLDSPNYDICSECEQKIKDYIRQTQEGNGITAPHIDIEVRRKKYAK